MRRILTQLVTIRFECNYSVKDSNWNEFRLSGIRSKMISNGRLRRYLAYAAGEVLLIVIGILIAIQLRDLNEPRKSLDLERSYLERLGAEVPANLVQFSEYQKTQMNAPKLRKGLQRSSMILPALMPTLLQP